MASSRFDDIPNITVENWAQASIKDRIEALQRVENKIADSQNRPRSVVIDFVGPPKNHGRFNPDEPTVIEINSSLIMSKDPRSAVAAVAHEGRHSYQMDCINNPARHPEAADKIEVWKDNVKNYISSDENQKAYEEQPVEADAIAHEKLIMAEIYPQPQKETDAAPDWKAKWASHVEKTKIPAPPPPATGSDTPTKPKGPSR